DAGQPTTATDSNVNNNKQKDVNTPSGMRGQFKTQNRMFLPDDWVFDTEVNYVSDKTFLKDFFPSENKEEKTPETLAYLKKLDGDSAVTGLLKYRLNTW